MPLRQPSPLQGQYAGFFSRFLAFMIDLLIVSATVVVLGAVVNLILDFFGLQATVDEWLQDSSSRIGMLLRLFTAIYGVTFVAVSYFVLFWVFTAGQTIGNSVMGLRVVRLNGVRLSVLRALARYIFLWLSVIPFGLGILWILVDDQRQGWHDSIVGTCVIYDWPAREDEGMRAALAERWETFTRRGRRFRGSSDDRPAG